MTTSPQEFELEATPSDVVRTYFLRALGTLETGQPETLAASLRLRGWTRGADLRSIRGDLVERTETLAIVALGALRDGRAHEAREALREALALW